MVATLIMSVYLSLGPSDRMTDRIFLCFAAFLFSSKVWITFKVTQTHLIQPEECTLDQRKEEKTLIKIILLFCVQMRRLVAWPQPCPPPLWPVHNLSQSQPACIRGFSRLFCLCKNQTNWTSPSFFCPVWNSKDGHNDMILLVMIFFGSDFSKLSLFCCWWFLLFFFLRFEK